MDDLSRSLAALAQLVRSDALAVVVRLPPGVRVIAAHGLGPAPEWLHPAAAAVVRRALDDKVAAGGAVSGISLADGRAASSIVVVTIPGHKEPHALVALRADPPFTPADAGLMTRAAELVAAEMRRGVTRTAAASEHSEGTRSLELLLTALLVVEALILVGAVAAGVGTITGLLLAGPIVGVAGGAARGGRIALRLAAGLSVLALADRATAQLLYGERGDVAFALEAGGALVALLALAASARVVLRRR